MKKKLCLVGYPASGKSKLGRMLAESRNETFVDLDKVIEARIGITINQYFEKYGEQAFRVIECEEAYRRLTDTSKSLISFGGGAFCHSPTQQLILKHGISIFFNPPKQILIERLQRSKKRPMFLNKDPVPILDNLISKRQSEYEKATITIALNDDLDNNLALIIKTINAYENNTSKD